MAAAAWIAIALPVVAQGATLPGGAKAAAANAKPNIVTYKPGMKLADLAGKPDTDKVELSGGRQVSVGKLRQLQAAGQRMRAANPSSKFLDAVKFKPAATGIPVKTGADLREAITKRQPRETLQLPSGKTITVAQLKYLQPLIEKRSGRKFDKLPARPDLTGTAKPVKSKAELKDLLSKPDNTVLESPRGKRITVGMLKQALKAGKVTLPDKGTAPPKAPPAGTPKKGVRP